MLASLLGLLIAAPAFAQTKTYTNSVTVGDTLYIVHTTVLPNGSTTSYVSEMPVPDLNAIFKQLGDAQKRWRERRDAKKAAKRAAEYAKNLNLNPLNSKSMDLRADMCASNPTLSFCPKPAPAPEN